MDLNYMNFENQNTDKIISHLKFSVICQMSCKYKKIKGNRKTLKMKFNLPIIFKSLGY